MYKIVLSKSAQRTYRGLAGENRSLFVRIDYVLKSLKKNPFQGKKLCGRLEGKRSLRVGDYRIIYAVEKNILVVYVLAMGPRRDIYR